MGDAIYSIEGCDTLVYCRSWCVKHYRRWKNHGDPTWVPPTMSVTDRFWSKVDKSGECWIWTAGLNNYGYGNFYAAGKYIGAHRFSYELANDTIPDGMVVDHQCFNTRCVNPDHLRLATIKQNGENRTGPQVNSTSGVRGVSWNKQTKKWHAQVGHKGRNHNAGEYAALSDAESAAVAKRNALFTHNDLDRIAG